MSRFVIYPGSFDPITLGHLSLLSRAAKVFDEIDLLIVNNPTKDSGFSLAQRAELVFASLAEVNSPSNITISTLESGLLAEHLQRVDARAVIRGVRAASDFEYELPMSQVNKDLSGIETVFFAAEPGSAFVSSSIVREVAMLGGDCSKYVTKAVMDALEKLRGSGDNSNLGRIR